LTPAIERKKRRAETARAVVLLFLLSSRRLRQWWEARKNEFARTQRGVPWHWIRELLFL
jgi:hypothetical protein